MKKESKQKKGFLIILFIISITIGIGIGIITEENETVRKFIEGKPLIGIILMVEVIVALLLHIFIHEGGHLVFGLVSGYEFCSFRIGSFMWVKEDNKIKVKRLSVNGLEGQCIMKVPDIDEDKIPVKLYMYGGVIMNIIVALICIVLAIECNILPVRQLMIIMAATGLLIAFTNGIPMNGGMAQNDGANARELKDNKAKHALLIQLKMSEQQARGVRLKNMPKDWFVMPAKDEKKYQACVSIGVFFCNRLMDQHNFDEAYNSIKELLDSDANMAMIHRRLLVCDMIYMELLRGSDKEIIEQLITNEQKVFMANMAKFPSVLRTEYAHALLYDNDEDKAGTVKKLFEDVAKTYPYPSDIISEQELIEVIDNYYNNV